MGPKWLDNAVFYEIYPQSFRDANGDGIGDFQGIIEKLPYIKELGCNAIWMNPCFESPFYDAGYDVADYYKTAPRYGTNEELIRLFDEVHKRDMHILLDLVPGHTSVEHPWFQASSLAEHNEFTDRYVWTDTVWAPIGAFQSIRGYAERDGAAIVNFFTHQPALNYGFLKPEEPWQQGTEDPGPRATLEAIMDVMRFWLKNGCDGFRVDMAGSLVKNDPDGLGTIALWQKVRRFLDEEFPEAAMISEWGEPDKSLAGGFHMDFLLQFGPSHYNDLFRCDEPFFSGRGKGTAKDFIARYLDCYKKTEGRGLMCIPSGNHDMKRLSKFLQGDELKAAFAFILSMPGAPFIYYGDEIGMRYREGLKSKEGGYERTGSRTPMQWDGTRNAGFSEAPADKLYLPVEETEDFVNVSEELSREDSLVNEVKRLIAVRQAHEALQSSGKIEFLTDYYPLIYKRSAGDEAVLVVINPSAQECSIEFAEAGDSFDTPSADTKAAGIRRLMVRDVPVLGEVLHVACGTLTVEEKKVHIGGISAGYIRLDR